MPEFIKIDKGLIKLLENNLVQFFLPRMVDLLVGRIRVAG